MLELLLVGVLSAAAGFGAAFLFRRKQVRCEPPVPGFPDDPPVLSGDPQPREFIVYFYPDGQKQQVAFRSPSGALARRYFEASAPVKQERYEFWQGKNFRGAKTRGDR